MKPVCWAFSDDLNAEFWTHGGSSKASAIRHGKTCYERRPFFVAPCYLSTEEQYGFHGCETTADSDEAVKVALAQKHRKGGSRGRVITRALLMRVLDKNFDAQGIRITVRGYNKILTDLGYRLGNYKGSKHSK